MTSLGVTLLVCSVSLVTASDVTQHRNWHLLDHEQCGESVTDRIIGGTAASLGEFPWMVRIGYTKTRRWVQKSPVFKCGGSLINSLYVVTAAHCVTKLKDEVVAAIRLGEYDMDTAIDCDNEGDCAPPPQDFRPAEIQHHEIFDHPPLKNDVALIRLDRPAQLNSFVSPICLPYGPILVKNYLNHTLEVAGWGVNDIRYQRGSHILLHVKVPILKTVICENALSSFAEIGPGQLCAGQIGSDSCGGDSGGPLMKAEAVGGPPKYFIIGVVSFGSVTCGSDIPAVYTDLRMYVEWILDHIKP